jgi:AcrR family transcriptional regulator
MQILKEETRENILNAALSEFAGKGFCNATMANIAAGAGISVGNLYLYYKNKDELFNSLISDEFIGELKALLLGRISSANGFSINDLGENPAHLTAGKEIIAFFCANRLRIVIAIENAHLSKFSGLKDEIVNYLDGLFSQYLKSIHDDFQPTDLEKLQPVVHIIYSSLVNSIVDLLIAYSNKEQLGPSLEKLLTYHLFGLKGLLGQ